MNTCTYEEACEKETVRRSLCHRHYRQELAGTLGIDTHDPFVDDDRVTGPDDLPIRPKLVRRLGEGSKRTPNPKRTKWAVVMPYPSLDGSQGCARYPQLFDPDSIEGGGGARSVEAMSRKELCQACPFRTACFEWAMAHELYGYWGGATESDRERLRKKRGQQIVTPGMNGAGLFPDRDWEFVLDSIIDPPDPEQDEEEDWYGAAPI